MNIHQIIVCGAGTMGSGIAQVAAQNGQKTFLYDLSPEALQKAKDLIYASWESLVGKQRMSPEAMAAARANLHFTGDPACTSADLVIEAIVEKTEAKISLFKTLAASAHDETIFASNTSSLSIDTIQQALPFGERVTGLHFFNPAPLMRLVEIVAGKQTDPRIGAILDTLLRNWGKVPVHCKDSPGFIVNRVARPYYLEALQLAEEGAMEGGPGGGPDFATIDRIAEASGFRMGPFRLMDLIGNDINLAVSKSLYEACDHPPRFKPSPIQEAAVARGELGRKTGKGYYTYS
jgi:3-hydroxybutyryl-CoA dehydrogenase